MMQEIVFTSARRGLRTGSTGFCTVRSTRGMPENLAQLLERLTGYAHVFDAYGAEASWNPVNYAHYVTRLGGQRFHILARISNAPLDHTNRSNKLAHLLTADSAVLEMDLSEGPASESLLIPWVKAWSSDQEPCVLSDDQQLRLPMSAQVPTSVCEAWKDATGDAGWAAVLASTIEENQSPLQIILPRDVGTRSDQWTLRLVNESLSLLPPETRWDVSYSTFYTGNLPVSISCQWQFVLDGTDLAKRARLDPRSRTIDLPTILLKKLAAPRNSLTDFATNGTRPWLQESESVTVARRERSRTARGATGATSELNSLDNEEVYDVVYPGSESDALPDHRSVGNSPSRRSPPLKPISRDRAARTPLLLRPVSLVAITIVGILILLLIFAAGQRSQKDDKTSRVIAEAEEKAKRRREERAERDERQRRAREEQIAEQQRIESQRANAAVIPESQSPMEMPAEASPKVVIPQKSTVVDSEPEQRRLSPLQEVRDKGNKLELRLPSSQFQVSEDGPIRLATIHVDSMEDVSLKRIIGGHSVLKSGYDYAITAVPSANASFREWEVVRQPVGGGGLGTRKDLVGTFRLNQKHELSFRWDKSNNSFEMINCLLEIEAGDPKQKTETEKCTLREVEHIPPIRFDSTIAERTVRLVNRSSVTDMRALELRFDYVGLPATVTRQGPEVLRVGDFVKFVVKPTTTGRYQRTATMTVSFVETEQDAQVKINATVDLLEQSRTGGGLEIQQVNWSPALAGKVREQLEAMDIQINRRRDELKERELVAESGRARRDAEAQKKVEEGLETFRNQINEQARLHLEFQQLVSDLEKLIEDISKNGHLKCSLRLRVPDSEPAGIELLVTDAPETTSSASEK